MIDPTDYAIIEKLSVIHNGEIVQPSEKEAVVLDRVITALHNSMNPNRTELEEWQKGLEYDVDPPLATPYKR